jgi:RNA polymerase sigma-70 factor (ECF subfamily)
VSLEKLIHQCKNQDIRAQEKLYRLYSGKLFGLCLKYSNNYQQAEDNLQDGFITIFNKINQYEDKGSFEGWMKRIVINTTLQKHRKEKYFEIINENLLEDPEIEVDDEEITTDFLLESIQDLPERYRQIFNLYALDGFSHKEIAEMLNISMGSSKSNLARARHILKSKIENHLNDNKVQSL